MSASNVQNYANQGYSIITGRIIVTYTNVNSSTNRPYQSIHKLSDFGGNAAGAQIDTNASSYGAVTAIQELLESA